MRKTLATTLFAALLAGCSAPDYRAMSIQEIVETTTVQEKHVWATTEFVIKLAKDAEVKKEDGT